jgi:phosphonate transport system substrate-binding protein
MTLKINRYSLARLLLLLVLLFAVDLHAVEHPARTPIRIGLTPVFLDHQPTLNNEWRLYLESRLGRPVIFVQRYNYHAIIDMLHNNKLDFAWVSGYPYVRNKDDLRLVAVPLYKGEPLYQSYLIVNNSDQQSRSLEDMRGKVFAFSDPDSNSGYLYIVHLLSKQGENPVSFFGKSFFTWSHLKVIEAVATGLAQGGAVDGYVWDTLALSHPEMTAHTRIVSKSPQFGSAPFVASRAISPIQIAALQRVLIQMVRDKEGRSLLKTLNLDGFGYGNELLYDSIENMSQRVEKSQQ